MAHYPHMYSLNCLKIEVRLGCLPPERAKPQPVEVCLRIYFPEAPECVSNDNGPYLDYDALAQEIRKAASGEYRLVEFLAGEIFRQLRQFVDVQQPEVKIWLRVVKCHPPVELLANGVSYILSDLPAGATSVSV